MTARTQKSFQRYKKMTAHLHRPPPTYTPMMACSAQVPNITVCTINSTRLYIILRSSIESIRNEEKKSRFVSRRILRTRFIEKKKSRRVQIPELKKRCVEGGARRTASGLVISRPVCCCLGARLQTNPSTMIARNSKIEIRKRKNIFKIRVFVVLQSR